MDLDSLPQAFLKGRQNLEDDRVNFVSIAFKQTNQIC